MLIPLTLGIIFQAGVCCGVAFEIASVRNTLLKKSHGNNGRHPVGLLIFQMVYACVLAPVDSPVYPAGINKQFLT